MLWLPDGLLSIPERLRARRHARAASAERAAAALRVEART
jgi:branched-chain amino acid transport system permease protein